MKWVVAVRHPETQSHTFFGPLDSERLAEQYAEEIARRFPRWEVAVLCLRDPGTAGPPGEWGELWACGPQWGRIAAQIRMEAEG